MKKNLFLLLIISLISCSFFKNFNNEINSVCDNYIKGTAYVTDFTIYGRYFNVAGELNEEFNDLILVFKNKDKEVKFFLEVEIVDGKTRFKTNKLINEGINLDKIQEGEYKVFIKDENGNYYNLNNKTRYDNLSYYTTTKNKKNKHIKISFLKENDYSYINIQSKMTSLPKGIYDIVIDPGHGGSDPGAFKNGYKESEINLDYAKSLKEELEKYGLKVKLTRGSEKSISNYGIDGRVSVPYTSKAKLMLSIHMNSSNFKVGSGGVEIYVPNKSNIVFATNLAKNIVGFTSSNYSDNLSNKVLSGVYLRTLSKSDLEDIKEDALENNYIPYEKATIESSYYYIIRETGGIITGAYVDSRTKESEWNIYYLSNHGCETYLLELGYINSSNNLKILLNEKDSYVKAIVTSVLEYLEI